MWQRCNYTDAIIPRKRSESFLNTETTAQNPNLEELVEDIRRWGVELGFQQVGIADINLSEAETRLDSWLDKNHHKL